MLIAGGLIHPAGRTDGFLARYNQDGETQWALAIGGTGDDSLTDVSSDGDGTGR